MAYGNSAPTSSKSTLGTSLDDICNKQDAYFRSGATLSLEFRIQSLKKLEKLIRDHQDKFMEALSLGLGKSDFEAYAGEVGFVIDEIKHSVKHLKKWMKPKRVMSPVLVLPASGKIHASPLGRVLIISPWNYPMQLLLSPLVGAIAAGNTAILKPSEVAPHTAKVIADLISEYFEEKFLTCFQGGVQTSTDLLAKKWDHIFYTGNGTVGKIVATAAAKHLTPITLELGGKSPCIVDSDIDIAVTARRIVWGKFFNAGQTCVAPDYLLVQESVKDELVKELSKTIHTFFGSDPEQSSDYGRIINENHFDRLSKLIKPDAVVHGGKTNREKKFIEPTLLSPVTLTDAVMKDEIFGPILPIMTYSRIEDAFEIIRNFEHPLACYLFTRNKELQNKVVEQISFGGGCINDTIVHLSNPNLPFGGVGSSGMGAYHGKHSFDLFSHQKSILKNNFVIDLPVRYQPINSFKSKLIRFLIGR